MTEQIQIFKDNDYYVNSFINEMGGIDALECSVIHVRFSIAMLNVVREYVLDNLIPGYTKENAPLDNNALTLSLNRINNRWRNIIDQIAEQVLAVRPSFVKDITKCYSLFGQTYNTHLIGVKIEERDSGLQITGTVNSTNTLTYENFHMVYIYNNYKHLYLTPTEVEVPEDPNPQDPTPEVPETQEPTDPEPTDPILENPDDTTTEPNTTEDNQG